MKGVQLVVSSQGGDGELVVDGCERVCSLGLVRCEG